MTRRLASNQRQRSKRLIKKKKIKVGTTTAVSLGKNNKFRRSWAANNNNLHRHDRIRRPNNNNASR